MKFVSKIEMSSSDKDQGKKIAIDVSQEKSQDFSQEPIGAQFKPLEMNEILKSIHQTDLKETEPPESIENRSYLNELK